MNLQLIKRGVVITIVVLFHMSLSGQNIQWPHGNSRGTQHSYDITPVKLGYIILENNDTIKGEIKIPPGMQFSYCSIIPERKQRANRNILDFNYREISRVRICPDSIAPNGSDFDCLKKKNKNKQMLYRLLGQRGMVAIYDDRVYTYDNDISGFEYEDVFTHKYYSLEMFLYLDGMRIKIYNKWALLNKHSKVILHFINRRYGTDFTHNDFSTIGEMIQYILKRENK